MAFDQKTSRRKIHRKKSFIIRATRTCSQDPSDGSEIPFCVLKSFPHNADHCVSWAAFKAKRLFEEKPAKFNEYFGENSAQEILDLAHSG
jgi:hypothetical protein